MATSCGLTEKDFEEQEQLQAISSQCADNSSAACNGSGACHTGDGRAATGSCRQQADQGRPQGSWARAAVTLGEEAQPAGPAPKPKHSTCVKCKQVQGVVSPNPLTALRTHSSAQLVVRPAGCYGCDDVACRSACGTARLSARPAWTRQWCTRYVQLAYRACPQQRVPVF